MRVNREAYRGGYTSDVLSTWVLPFVPDRIGRAVSAKWISNVAVSPARSGTRKFLLVTCRV